ncbi:hypothetical protein [Niabella hirudinis]|uniref:hypothetical protein n=1 Tax=Niabella hirudinis TaxID=1285929 RepID=UPI003EC03D7D
MKPFIFPAFMLLSFAANAQQKTGLPASTKPIITNTNITMRPVTTGSTALRTTPTTSAVQEKPKPGSGNTSPSSSAPGLTDADYFLAVARVTIKTAGDNKEKLSKMMVSVYPAAGDDNYQKGYTLESWPEELKVWSTTNFTLPRRAGFEQAFNSLAHYRQTGVMLDVLYNTVGNGLFYISDAWKIQEVSVTLEFKDKNGNPHPTYGSKTLYFPGVYLDFYKWKVYYKTDPYFNTLPPTIENRQ